MLFEVIQHTEHLLCGICRLLIVSYFCGYISLALQCEQGEVHFRVMSMPCQLLYRAVDACQPLLLLPDANHQGAYLGIAVGQHLAHAVFAIDIAQPGGPVQGLLIVPF